MVTPALKSCPICHRPMDQRPIASNVVIDFCRDHGIWFDQGELEALLQRSDAREIVEGIAKRFGRSVIHGAGFTTGGRIVNGLIDAVFGKD